MVSYEAQTLLGLGVSRCPTRVVSDTTPTHIITLNYRFSQIISCVGMSVLVSCPYPCFIDGKELCVIYEAQTPTSDTDISR
jgi:hypothetical protein